MVQWQGGWLFFWLVVKWYLVRDQPIAQGDSSAGTCHAMAKEACAGFRLRCCGVWCVVHDAIIRRQLRWFCMAALWMAAVRWDLFVQPDGDASVRC